MKILKQLLLSAVAAGIFAPSVALASGFVAGPHFFFAVVQDADGWDYKIPDCTVLPDPEFKKLKRQCKTESDHSKRCPTERTVTLKNVAPATTNPVGAQGEKAMEDAQKVDDTTKTFRLDYIVFISAKQCKRDRESAIKAASTKPK